MISKYCQQNSLDGLISLSLADFRFLVALGQDLSQRCTNNGSLELLGLPGLLLGKFFNLTLLVLTPKQEKTECKRSETNLVKLSTCITCKAQSRLCYEGSSSSNARARISSPKIGRSIKKDLKFTHQFTVWKRRNQFRKNNAAYPSIGPDHSLSLSGIDLVAAVVAQWNPEKQQ